MAFALGNASRFAAPTQPSEWLTYFRPYVKASLERLPAFFAKALSEHLEGMDTSAKAFEEYLGKEHMVDAKGEEALPGFSARLSEEQHALYMMPFLIDTPPLMIALRALDKKTAEEPTAANYTITDAHANYKLWLEYAQFRASNACPDPRFVKNVNAALRKYTSYTRGAADTFAKAVEKLVTARKAAERAPKNDSDPMPDLADLYNEADLIEFARIAYNYNRSLLAGAELAIVIALGVSPEMSAAARLVSVNVSARPRPEEIDPVIADMARREEANLVKECCADYNKKFEPPRSPPVGLAAWMVSPAFLFNNLCLFAMKLDR